MEKLPKVSVVMSVYNDATYLGQAIESILDQTLTNFEFLIINDGCTDGSRAIISSFDDPRIRLIVNETNLGLPTSLNKGIEFARGEYIARQDADDVSLPDRLAEQQTFLDTHRDVAVVGCWWTRIDLDGDEFTRCEIPDDDAIIKAKLIRDNVKFPHGSSMFRKEPFEYVGGYHPDFHFTQDLDLWLRLAKASCRFGAVESHLYKLRDRLEPDGFKAKWQARYRVLAYQRYHSDEELEVPNIACEAQRVRLTNAKTSRRAHSNYWYSVGMRAYQSRRYGQALKCLGRLLLTADVMSLLRFASRLALKTGDLLPPRQPAP